MYWCFFFKQKTAYEMRISDWSSDVCSSYLRQVDRHLMRTEKIRRKEQRKAALLMTPEAIILDQLEGRRQDPLGVGPAQIRLHQLPFGLRSEERRVGKGWASMGSSRWSPYH